MNRFLCQFCNHNQSKSFLTKCCKCFICQSCKQQNQNKSQCICGNKINNKKLCTENQVLFKIITKFMNIQEKQCERCCQQKSKCYCKNCKMYFCQNCSQQLHQSQREIHIKNKKGFRNHQIINKEGQKLSFQKQISRIIKKSTNLCQLHKQSIEYICECSNMLCSICFKTHKQKCEKPNSRIKSSFQYQQQYYHQILFKLNQITQYKQNLKNNKIQYQKHFIKQSQIYNITKQSINNQFISLKNILQLKHKQIEQKMINYWQNCMKIYHQNLYFIDFHMKKYDDYAKLAVRFTQNYVGLDYLQKKIKKVNVNNEIFNFYIQSTDDIKQKLMNINSNCKDWQKITSQNLILLNSLNEQTQQKKLIKKSQLSNSLIQNSESLLIFNNNPKSSRPLIFNCSHNQIQFNFIHLPYQNQTYEIQYGVGFKMKGVQIFKKLQNKNGRGVIQGLNPSTKYRIRMKVKDQGQYGQIYQVSTFELPKIIFDVNNICKSTGETTFQFLKQGTIYSNNPLNFGVHYWTVILNSQKSSYDDSETACIGIGISNKQQKKNNFTGATFNYGYQREQIIIKIKIDCQQQFMIISSGTNKQEKYSCFPYFPIFPTIQNKSSATVHIKYSFNKQDY